MKETDIQIYFHKISDFHKTKRTYIKMYIMI